LVLALALTGPGLAQQPGGEAKVTPPGALLTSISPAPGAAVEEISGTLDQALSEAMERNPDIVTAKAKLRLAEAELNGVRMEVAGKVVTLWSERETQEKAAASAGRNRDFVRLKYDRGLAQLPEFETANKALIDAEASLARIQTGLRYQIGQVASAARSSETAAGTAPRLMAAPLQMPRGPMVEGVRQELLKPAELDFIETPLGDVMAYLKELRGIDVQIDEASLLKVGARKGAEMPITFNVKGVSLAAALQAMEDKFVPLKFVVRDYGILVTTREHAQEEGFFPVVEFARLSGGGEAAAPSKPLEPVRPKEAPPAENRKARPKPTAADPFALPPKSSSETKPARRAQPFVERSSDPFAH
jgi:hypothetical protein